MTMCYVKMFRIDYTKIKPIWWWIYVLNGNSVQIKEWMKKVNHIRVIEKTTYTSYFDLLLTCALCPKAEGLALLATANRVYY